MTYDNFLRACAVILQFSMVQGITFQRTIKYNTKDVIEVGTDFISLGNQVILEYENCKHFSFYEFLNDFYVSYVKPGAKYPSLEMAGIWFDQKLEFEKSKAKGI